MVRGPFDEAIFWNIRILKAWEDNPALVLPKPEASTWSSVFASRLLFVAEASFRSFAQALIGEGSRTSNRLRLKAMACKKAAN